MFSAVLTNALYLLVVINPVSKIALLSPCAPEKGRGELAAASVKSTCVAAAILLGAVFCGDFLLRRVFRIELCALQIAGGIVLAWVGFQALRRGVFFEMDLTARFADLAIVPLACPMIAGPATITAALSLRSAVDPLWLTLSIALALAANLLCMACAAPVGRLLTKFNIMGALIRITGLIVMTMGVQMVIDGIDRRF